MTSKATRAKLDRAANIIRGELGHIDSVVTNPGENRDESQAQEKMDILRRDTGIDRQYEEGGYIRYELEKGKSVKLHVIKPKDALAPAYVVDRSTGEGQVGARGWRTLDAACDDFITRVRIHS